MTERKIKSANPSLIWSLYFVLSVNLLFFELPVFDEHFKTELEYLYVLIPLLVCFFALNKVAMKIPLRILSTFIICCFIGLSFIWYMIAYNLPMPMANFGCDSFICEKYGQIALVVINFGILLPLLNEWTLHTQERGFNYCSIGKNLYMGLILISQGLISLIDYYWTPFSTFLLSMISMILFANISRKLISMPKSDDLKSISELLGTYRASKLTIYNNRFFKDLLFLAFISLFGFSLLDHNKFLFDLFIPIGIGFLIYEGILHINKMNDSKAVNIYILDGIIYFIAFLTQLIIFEILYNNLAELGQEFFEILNDLIIIVCIPTGVYLAYFLDRIGSFIQRTDYPIHQDYFIHYKCKILSKYSADIFSIEFMFLIWFVISLIKVVPEGEDVLLIYGIGLVALLFLFVLWITDLIKSKKNLKRPNLKPVG